MRPPPRFRLSYLYGTPMSSNRIIRTTAADVATELARRGIDPAERLVVLRLSDWLAEARRESRKRVVAAGLSDEDIDQMIEEAREEVQHLIK